MLGAVVSIYARTSSGTGPTTKVEAVTLGVLIAIALPGATLPYLTRRWQIWIPVCALSVAGWAVFIGPPGDLSCAGCGFVLFVPLNIAGLQLLLVVLALVFRSMRQRSYN